MSDAPRNRKSLLITKLDVVDENHPKRRRQRARAERLRRKKIEGWTRNRFNQTIKVNKVIEIGKKVGQGEGKRMYVCPRCDGKKKLRTIIKPGEQGWVLAPGQNFVIKYRNCNACRGKGYLWV